MAKRKLNLPIAIIAGLGAGMADPIKDVINGNIPGALKTMSARYTGYSPRSGTWSPEFLKKGLLPLVAGILIHKFVGGAPLNVNKALASAGVPIIRI